MVVFAYTASVNIVSYNADDGSYQMYCPTILGPDILVDDARPTIYLAFTEVTTSKWFSPRIEMISP